MRTGLAIVLIIFFSVASAAAQDGLALMKVEAGARPAGMGGAFVAMTGEPNATFYNPAGAAWTSQFTASLGHNTYWENVRLETAYLFSNLTDRLAIHGGIRYAAISDLEGRTGPTSDPETYFDAHDVAVKAGLAYAFTEKLAVGFAAGWFQEKIETVRGSAFNVDLGAIYRLNPSVDLGASIANLGPDFSLSVGGGSEGTSDISMPTTYRAGGVYRDDRYLGSADLVIVDDEAHLHVGAEGMLHELFSVRAGYMFNYDSKNFTAGASFSQRKLTIDYAFVPYSNDLGTSHLFNLTVTL